MAWTFSTIGGNRSRTLWLPILLTNVSRPGLLCGSSRSTYSTASSGVMLGPNLTPTGLAITWANAMCAPSICRVRSPIHTVCADRSNSCGSPSSPSDNLNMARS
ncbi:Uncharacterised protein [Mycobacterium tuberculosis]|nr:Uncharacterised protein [Mycobacterium tuberculosis]